MWREGASGSAIEAFFFQRQVFERQSCPARLTGFEEQLSRAQSPSIHGHPVEAIDEEQRASTPRWLPYMFTDAVPACRLPCRSD